MLNLITATPGSGKTLYALLNINKQATNENRQVYYSGIPLTENGKKELGWIELEKPDEWFLLPAGAIIVIDECQRIFPPRRSGTTIPKHVSMFETHRHHSFDVFLITQSPKLLDSHVREITNKHIHLKRVFGSSRAAVLKWDACELSPNTVGASQRCLDKSTFSYPKKVYSWYTSSQLHTHKLQIPKVAWYSLAAILFLVPALFIAVKSTFGLKDASPALKAANQQQTVASATTAISYHPASSSQTIGYTTPEELQRSYAPLDPARPETAPRYASLSTPTAMPNIKGCIKSASKCTCYTDQATVVDVPKSRCEQVISNGMFDEYLQPDRQQPQNQIATAPQVQRLPAHDLAQNEPHVVTLGDAKKPNLM